MSISLLHIGSEVALGYDSATGEKGILLKVYVAEAVLKGELLSVSTATDSHYIKQTNEFDVTCIAQETVGEAKSIWAWTTGSICQVRYKDDTASVRGYVCIADGVDGRASDLDISTIQEDPPIATHFKEIGHVKETKAVPSEGNSNLVLIHFHTL